MYNVFKPLAITLIAAGSLTVMPACGGKSNDIDAEAAAALQQAQSLLDQGNARVCVTMLDSIDMRYAADTEILRQSLALRPKALLQITLDEIASADSAVVANKAALDSLKPLMKHIDVPGTEGYSLKATAWDASFMDKSGISARVSEIGEFYLVSSVNPAGGLQHWSVSAVVGSNIATTDTVAYDGALSYRINNSEVITFTPAQSDAVGSLIASSETDTPVKVLFNGPNGRHRDISLTSSQVDGIATAYRYASAVKDMRNATIDKERLARRLDTLRQQIAAGENAVRSQSDQQN